MGSRVLRDRPEKKREVGRLWRNMTEGEYKVWGGGWGLATEYPGLASLRKRDRTGEIVSAAISKAAALVREKEERRPVWSAWAAVLKFYGEEKGEKTRAEKGRKDEIVCVKLEKSEEWEEKEQICFGCIEMGM
ncbi:hypothetical protein DdX_18669 [Ditylenchus destructor]|uniref:Uncharacterized protein n=1 Tax=Ditylenchus destructor TaxID=166010 RepID=A0AAD4MPM4_9BILA|nr:hypothetical protein DdX_18669 [Ditylenchus destructor]